MILTISFEHPWALLLFLLPVIMAIFQVFWRTKSLVKANVSTLFNLRNLSLKTAIVRLLPWLHIIAATLLVICIARPQDEMSSEKSRTKGIDIILAIDVSTSMLETDLRPNRMQAAKQVASEFVSKRPNDRIGVVVFSGESYTQCPPTIDHEIVQKQIKTLRNGIIDDGTAIGMGLATSVRTLKNSNSKSKVCILLTDGMNTAGIVDPMTATEIAKTFNIKVYCIGVGTPRNNILGIDEPLMRKISSQTGGLYFRAGSLERLKQIYEEINKLETIEIEKNAIHKRTDFFFPFALVALVLVLLSFILRHTWLRGV